jgi:nicotinamidase-related amidase
MAVQLGSLKVLSAPSTLIPITSLMSLPGFVLKLATQDSHPPNHISFASNHTRESTSDGQDPKPFTTFTRIANPLNVDDIVESRLWPDHCVQNTTGEKLIEGVEWQYLTRIDKDIISKLHDLYPMHNQNNADYPGFQYAALPSSDIAIFKKGLVPSLEQYSAFTPPFTNPPIHPPPSYYQHADSHKDRRPPPLLTCLLQAYAVTHVYVVGLAYDYCVKETALDTVRQGFVTYIVEKGTMPVDESAESLGKVKAELKAGNVHILEGDLDDIEEIRWVKNANILTAIHNADLSNTSLMQSEVLY